jgi:hypothetical protein
MYVLSVYLFCSQVLTIVQVNVANAWNFNTTVAEVALKYSSLTSAINPLRDLTRGSGAYQVKALPADSIKLTQTRSRTRPMFTSPIMKVMTHEPSTAVRLRLSKRPSGVNITRDYWLSSKNSEFRTALADRQLADSYAATRSIYLIVGSAWVGWVQAIRDISVIFNHQWTS